jgi:cobyric acid synthase
MLDAEDAIATAAIGDKKNTKLKVIAPAYPRTSNHNDLDPAPASGGRFPRAGRARRRPPT